MKPTAVLSHKLRTTLDALRSDFTGFQSNFSILTARRETLAPTFLKAYQQYRRETHRSFVAFVAELDPALPVADKAYLYHRSYQAALYLRRIAEAPHTQAKHRRTESPYTVLAVVIRSVTPFVHPHERSLWNAIAEASGWRPRDMERLQQAVRRAHAFQIAGAPRLVQHQLAKTG